MYFAGYKSCNLNCDYCYVPRYNKNQQKEDDSLILESLKRFIQKVETEGFQIGAFCLHGAEPALMSPESLAETANMVGDHWEKSGSGYKEIAIQSNGTRFNQEYLLRLKEQIKPGYGIRLGFSIDPPRVVHNRYRNNSFDKVEKNFETAFELGFPVSVLSVISDYTMEHLPSFGSWIIKQIQRKEQLGNPYKVKAKLLTGELGFSGKNSLKLARFLIDHGLESLMQILTPGYCLQAGNECDWFECDWEGGCYSCNKNFNVQGRFASWETESFTEIIKKRKNLFLSEFTHPECALCPYEYFCNSGCPADRIQSGPMKGKAHECDIIKIIINELQNRNVHIVDFLEHNT